MDASKFVGQLTVLGFFGFGGFLLGYAPADAATTLQFANKGVAVVDAQFFPMADGSRGETFRSRLVAETVGGDFKGQMLSGNCYGQGSTSAAGAYLGSVACTMDVSADDAYSWTTANDSANGGDFVVTGGECTMSNNLTADARATGERAVTGGPYRVYIAISVWPLSRPSSTCSSLRLSLR
jgi:hypothetical protein